MSALIHIKVAQRAHTSSFSRKRGVGGVSQGTPCAAAAGMAYKPSRGEGRGEEAMAQIPLHDFPPWPILCDIEQSRCDGIIQEGNRIMGVPHKREEQPEDGKRKFSNLPGVFWALPLTILGLLLAFPVFMWRGHAYVVRDATPALLICGPLGDFLLAHHPFGQMSAMAIGHVVLCEQKGLSRRILTHELEHVRQAMRWGILFPFAYIASSVWAKLRGRDAYWHNVFEIAARDAEKHI